MTSARFTMDGTAALIVEGNGPAPSSAELVGARARSTGVGGGR